MGVEIKSDDDTVGMGEIGAVRTKEPFITVSFVPTADRRQI